MFYSRLSDLRETFPEHLDYSAYCERSSVNAVLNLYPIISETFVRNALDYFINMFIYMY